MNEEWGTPISKEKIIDRRNKLIEYQKTQDMRFTAGYQIIDENILAINYMIYEIERLNNIINELNHGIKELDNMFYETFRISQNGYYSISEWELKEFTDKLQELKGSEKE